MGKIDRRRIRKIPGGYRNLDKKQFTCHPLSNYFCVKDKIIAIFFKTNGFEVFSGISTET